MTVVRAHDQQHHPPLAGRRLDKICMAGPSWRWVKTGLPWLPSYGPVVMARRCYAGYGVMVSSAAFDGSIPKRLRFPNQAHGLHIQFQPD